jgi:hypothetical protein
MPVKVFSGIAPPQALLDAMAAASPQPNKLKPQPSIPAENENARPAMPPRPSGEPVPVNSGDAYDTEDAPPSYEDAMADHLSPVDGPRREYHPPDASQPMESGTDAKSVAQQGKALEDGPAAEGSSAPRRRNNRSSSESFDMLPTTPPESPSGSAPPSPVQRPGSMMKMPRNPAEDESPPQYEPVAGSHNNSQTAQRQPSGSNIRPMNLGVPNRKPVPGSPANRGR